MWDAIVTRAQAERLGVVEIGCTDTQTLYSRFLSSYAFHTSSGKLTKLVCIHIGIVLDLKTIYINVVSSMCTSFL